MGKLYCLIGKSGSGKDTIFKYLLNDKELSLSPVVTYTTRPRRENETDGVEYNFITADKLKNYEDAGQIIELRKYDTVQGTWYYCTVDDGKIDLKNGSYLIITTLQAFARLKKRFGQAAVPIYITVEDGERLSRILCREKAQYQPDYNEICRRFLADSSDFSDNKLKEAGIEKRFSNEDINRCVAEIKKYILYMDKK